VPETVIGLVDEVANRMKTIRHTQERLFGPQLMLIHAARHAADAAAKREPGSFYDALSAITLAALAIEASGNAVGAVELPKSQYDEFERLGPTEKIVELASHLGIAYSRQIEPWASALWLVGFRNDVAHAKPEMVTYERLVNEFEYEKSRRNVPESKLEKEITVGNAKRAVQTADAVLAALCSKLDPEKAMGLTIDGWSGSAKWVPD
jgi:hypothetical protein